MNDGDLVNIKRTGAKDIHRVLRGVHQRAVEKALAETRRVVDNAAQKGLQAIIQVVNTSGAGMPYKHDKNTDARVHTGAMRDSASVRWDRDDAEGITVTIGFLSTPHYTPYQEEGTRKLRAMQALAKARAAAEDVIDHARLTEGGLKK